MPDAGHAARTTALFVGSFDPLTLGHLDLIARASQLFTSLIVAVGEAQAKQPVFSPEERRQLIQSVCAPYANVRVEAFSGLAVDCAKRCGAQVLIRGLRSATDFDYEMQMAQMNQALSPGLETVFLPTSPALRHISSSLAKEIARHGGDPGLLVPAQIAVALKQKFVKSKPSSAS